MIKRFRRVGLMVSHQTHHLEMQVQFLPLQSIKLKRGMNDELGCTIRRKARKDEGEVLNSDIFAETQRNKLETETSKYQSQLAQRNQTSFRE